MQALKTKGEAVLQKKVEFDTLLADCAFEIRNGFLLVFPDGWVINCNFHVQQNIQKRAKKDVKDDKNRNLMLSDIKMLQLSQSESVFEKASKLLIKKWNKTLPGFTKYFEENYVKQRSNWYEGIAMLSPSTNNTQESTNGKIKLLFTNKRRITMQEMKNLSADMIKSWSKDLEKEKPFAEKVTFTEQEIVEAYLWMKKKDLDIFNDPDEDENENENADNSMTIYWVAAEGESALTSRTIRDIKEMNYTSFDSFKQKNFRAVKVIIHRPIEEQRSFGICTCKAFFKNFKCIHTLGIAIRMGDYHVSADVKQKAKQQFESSIPLADLKTQAQL